MGKALKCWRFVGREGTSWGMEQESDSWAKFPNQELETLWAPWRVEYFKLPRPLPDFLLDAAHSSDDEVSLVVVRRKNSFLILNKYPYTVGHLMAVPYRKVADMEGLSDQEKLELWGLAIHAQKLLKAVLKAQGFNVGINLGRFSGAGAPDHMHIHIVPRWEGDFNFMPVLGRTQVISEALRELYRKLVEAHRSLDTS